MKDPKAMTLEEAKEIIRLKLEDMFKELVSVQPMPNNLFSDIQKDHLACAMLNNFINRQTSK